ncbi:roadblock/LC7 domain-containing protein [Deinococcus navajonensis]|uniref:Roadblock/LC7 domain-containing protein n=1 Tax=Deinococcus navajonensis TaxID=309884 RepID=A0ABV8XP48_9DEIO
MIGPLMEVRGVRHAALLDAEGQVLDSAGVPEEQAGQLGLLVSAGRAVIASLRSATGATTWTELMLDVNGGPVLLTPHGDQVLLAAFDDVSSLGRVRFAVRRLLGT